MKKPGKIEVERINMDELSKDDQLKALLHGNLVNENFVVGILPPEIYIDLKLILLRLTTSIYSLICSTFVNDQESKELISNQAKASVKAVINMIELLTTEIDVSEVFKNVH